MLTCGCEVKDCNGNGGVGRAAAWTGVGATIGLDDTDKEFVVRFFNG